MIINRNINVDADELNALLATNGWSINPVERLQSVLDRLWGWITVRHEDGQLIGYVQILSDGVRHALIIRLLVHPEFRYKGIGTSIMNEALDMIFDHGLLPVLTANPGMADYYGKFGFETESAGYTAMCIKERNWRKAKP
jgi:predicted GNAT family N-acyltransferase